MTDSPRNGEKRKIHGKPCVFYDEYWIRWCDPPPDTLASKKALIDQMARRLFHHAEPGRNTPGRKLEAARAAYEGERHPVKKRVKGAMLAGALFNRGTDILGRIVDLQEMGVEVRPSHELMKECERPGRSLHTPSTEPGPGWPAGQSLRYDPFFDRCGLRTRICNRALRSVKSRDSIPLRLDVPFPPDPFVLGPFLGMFRRSGPAAPIGTVIAIFPQRAGATRGKARDRRTHLSPFASARDANRERRSL